jgi:hypothetical protein
MNQEPFEIETFLQYKESELIVEKCVVEKVIRLPGSEYDSFTTSFFKDRDFIKENLELMGYHADGKTHCLLVVGEGRRDGVLVNSAGYDYARYTAPIPYATDIVHMHQEPVLKQDVQPDRPSLTYDDLLLYGYSYEGMTPHDQEHALELYDYGFSVYLLYDDDTEALAESRADIEKFDGMFGVENAAYKDRLDADKYHMPIEVFVANTNPQGNERAVVERLRLPTERGEARSVLCDVGANIDNPETYRIVAFHASDPVKACLSKSDSLDELNMLAEFLYGLEDWEKDKLGAILQSGFAKADGVAGLINILYADNFEKFDLISAQNPEGLGRYWAEESPEAIPEDMSPAEYGRLCVAEEKGVFTDYGYVRERHGGMAKVYDGVVPFAYRLTKDRPAVEKPFAIAETQDRPATEKPSTVAEIRGSKSNASYTEKPREQGNLKNKDDLEL